MKKLLFLVMLSMGTLFSSAQNQRFQATKAIIETDVQGRDVSTDSKCNINIDISNTEIIFKGEDFKTQWNILSTKRVDNIVIYIARNEDSNSVFVFYNDKLTTMTENNLKVTYSIIENK